MSYVLEKFTQMGTDLRISQQSRECIQSRYLPGVLSAHFQSKCGVLPFNSAYFLGATPQLKNLDMVSNPADRFRLMTCAMGKVHVEVSVVLRNFEKSVEL